jgi:hypothetical protein
MNIDNRTLLTAASEGMTVQELLADIMDGSPDAERSATRQAMAAVERESIEQPHERVTRKRVTRDGTANRKVYVVLRATKGKGKGQPAVEPSDLPASYMRVWDYLKKNERNGKGIESRTITAAIGCPQKTTESALYWLRQAKAVESR